MTVPFWAWAAFATVVVVMLAVDLLAHRRAHAIGFREAAIWSAVWVGMALIFAGIVAATLGSGPAVDFTTAWLLEKSLSVDNLFVFALIFAYFRTPAQHQHKVLFFGVIGALVFRGIFLGAGVAIVSTFTAVLFVFAAILLYSAYKLLKDDDASIDPGRSLAVRLLRRVIPVTDDYHGDRFLLRRAGRWVATPLLAVVVAIEAADLVFAVDSVPAVLAVSDDAFIVYTSNAFAILGLRALYFLLAGMLDRFHLLGKALALVLAFIGLKLTLTAAHETISTSVPEIPSLVSLGVIVVALTTAIVLSLRTSPAEPAAAEPLPDRVGEQPEQGALVGLAARGDGNRADGGDRTGH
jgi:tellurite resistance protein TerC